MYSLWTDVCQAVCHMYCRANESTCNVFEFNAYWSTTRRTNPLCPHSDLWFRSLTFSFWLASSISIDSWICLSTLKKIPPLIICVLKLGSSAGWISCMSVSLLAYFLTEIRQIKWYLQFWMRYLSEFFWRRFWNVSILDPNNSEILVCLSVC